MGDLDTIEHKELTLDFDFFDLKSICVPTRT